MPKRDDFSLSTKRRLAERAGFQCTFPNCGAMTIGASSSDMEKSVSVGEASHISAASPGGPRYNEKLSQEYRSSIENGIWLCRTHAALIDRDGKKYPVELLKKWKLEAEKRSESIIGEQNNLTNIGNKGSKITILGDNSLTCLVKNIETQEIQGELSNMPDPKNAHLNIVLNTNHAQNYGESFYWSHSVLYDNSELTVATFTSPNLKEITIGNLLSEVYNRFFAGVVPPFSYGYKWILCSLGWGATEILAPWGILNLRSTDDEGVQFYRNEYNKWAKLTLEQNHVTDRGFWVIRDPSTISIFGTATNYLGRAQFARNVHPEAWKQLLRSNQRSSIKIEPFNYSESFINIIEDIKGKSMISLWGGSNQVVKFKHKILFEDRWWGGGNGGNVFIVSDEDSISK